jgi:hypothetical protein
MWDADDELVVHSTQVCSAPQKRPPVQFASTVHAVAEARGAAISNAISQSFIRA